MRGWVAAVALCAIVTSAPRVVAQTVDTTVNACVTASTGHLRVVNAGVACRRRERALTWAVAGPAGTPGTTGPKGDPGPPGPSGPPRCRVVGRLSIAGIMGEGLGGAMDVYDYEVGTTPSAGGPPTVQSISVTKPIDKASPMLLLAALSATPAPTATLDIFAADGITVATSYGLASVLISSFSASTGKTCSADRPVDELGLTFAMLTVSGGT